MLNRRSLFGVAAAALASLTVGRGSVNTVQAGAECVPDVLLPSHGGLALVGETGPEMAMIPVEGLVMPPAVTLSGARLLSMSINNAPMQPGNFGEFRTYAPRTFDVTFDIDGERVSFSGPYGSEERSIGERNWYGELVE